MANRLNIKARAEFRPENRKLVDSEEVEFNLEPANKRYNTGIQTIGTTEEALDVGDVSSAGYILVINLDDTNYVEVGLTGSYCIELPKNGGFAVFPPTGTIMAKANSAECDIEFYVFPDES